MRGNVPADVGAPEAMSSGYDSPIGRVRGANVVVSRIPVGWGSAPGGLGKGAVVSGVTEWSNVPTGRDVPSLADKVNGDEVMVTDGVLVDVTAVVTTDETGVGAVVTGWSPRVDGRVGGRSRCSSSPLETDGLEPGRCRVSVRDVSPPSIPR